MICFAVPDDSCRLVLHGLDSLHSMSHRIVSGLDPVALLLDDIHQSSSNIDQVNDVRRSASGSIVSVVLAQLIE
jgi:hypothetical protein